MKPYRVFLLRASTEAAHFSLSLKSRHTREGDGWGLLSALLHPLSVALLAAPLIVSNCICSASICTATVTSEGFPRDKGLYFTSMRSYLQYNVINSSLVCPEKTKLNSWNGIWRSSTFLPFGIIQPITLCPAVPVLWCPPPWVWHGAVLEQDTILIYRKISAHPLLIKLLNSFSYFSSVFVTCPFVGTHILGHGLVQRQSTQQPSGSPSALPGTLDVSPTGVEQTLGLLSEGFKYIFLLVRQT